MTKSIVFAESMDGIERRQKERQMANIEELLKDLRSLNARMLAHIANTEREADREQAADEPESIPVAELAEVLGCVPDAASVRMRLQDITSEEDGPQPDADGWYVRGNALPSLSGRERIDVDRTDASGQFRPLARDTRADNLVWYEVTRWRYADGRDTGGGSDADT